MNAPDEKSLKMQAVARDLPTATTDWKVGDAALDRAPTDEEIVSMLTRTKLQKATDTQVGGDHYKSMPIQPVDFIHANKLGFFEGNIIKYVCRFRSKHGKEDLLKARHYIDLLLEKEYGAGK